MTAPAQLDLFGSAATSRLEPSLPVKARPARKPAHEPLKRVWKTALGISVGDLVRTSYNTGPYEVWDIEGPRWWETNYSGQLLYLWQAPVISLRGVLPGVQPRGETDFYYLNTIYQVDGRWITAGGDGIYVQPGFRATQSAIASDEANPWETPYRRVAGVDYDAGEGRVFTCWTGDGPGQPGSVRCCDFNGEIEVTHRSMGRVWGAARCPRCGHPVTREVWLMRLPA